LNSLLILVAVCNAGRPHVVAKLVVEVLHSHFQPRNNLRMSGKQFVLFADIVTQVVERLDVDFLPLPVGDESLSSTILIA